VIVDPLSTNALAGGPSAAQQDRPGSLQLLPDQPPGRSTRKALPFAAEIRRLHAMGYTLKAIREALCAVGVSVSRSTVHREVRRNSESAPVREAAQPASIGIEPIRTPLPSLHPPVTRVQATPRSEPIHTLLAKQDAEAFFASHDSNPLSPTKETS